MKKIIFQNTGLLPAVIIPWAACVFLSCASASPSFNEPVRNIPSDFTGIVHAGGTRTQQEYDLLNYMGASWVLHTFYWSSIEREPDQWNFKYYDEIVDMAGQSGIKTLGVLAYDNWFIHDDEKQKYYIPPDKIPYFLEYIRKTAEHFCGRIGAWSIWNEPNFSFWKGTDKEFFELTRLAAEAIREVDSEVILLGGSFIRGIFGPPKKYIKGLFESGAMEKIDNIAFHPYELNPRRAARLYDKFKKIVNYWDYGDKIWLTEIGYPTGGGYPTKISEKKLGAYVIKTYTLMAAREAQKMLWYQLFDPVNRRSAHSESFFGLVRSTKDYTSKGAEAFKLCAAYVSGTRCYTGEDLGKKLPPSLAAYYFSGNNSNALILWNNSPGTIKIHAALPGTDHTRHDPHSGAASSVPANGEIKVGSTPIFITWQGGSTAPVLNKYYDYAIPKEAPVN